MSGAWSGSRLSGGPELEGWLSSWGCEGRGEEMGKRGGIVQRCPGATPKVTGAADWCSPPWGSQETEAGQQETQVGLGSSETACRGVAEPEGLVPGGWHVTALGLLVQEWLWSRQQSP